MPTAVITGAGSGVGQACAVALAGRGYRCALVGRRGELLEQTRARLANASAHLALPCDIADPAAVRGMAARVRAHFGGVDVLVNAAGTNVPARSLEVLSLEDYQQIVGTNLNGAYLCLAAFLPGMREQGRGTIVNIVSDAGLLANAKAGPAYVASKFALTGLTQSINAEERARGIRAVAICPGDIDTPILEKRPVPPPAEARARMLQAEDVAACVLLAVELPPRAIIEQLVIRPA